MAGSEPIPISTALPGQHNHIVCDCPFALQLLTKAKRYKETIHISGVEMYHFEKPFHALSTVKPYTADSHSNGSGALYFPIFSIL